MLRKYLRPVSTRRAARPKEVELPVLDRLRNLPIGALGNRLRIGDFLIAFDDCVLLVENSSLTLLNAEVSPDQLRVIIGDKRLLIDMWPRSACSVRLQATPEELSAAEMYFRRHGFEVCRE